MYLTFLLNKAKNKQAKLKATKFALTSASTKSTFEIKNRINNFL